MAVARSFDPAFTHYTAHIPSMLQNAERGVPTKIEALTCYAARRAAELGSMAPETDLLARSVGMIKRG